MSPVWLRSRLLYQKSDVMKYALACDSFRVSFRTFSQSSLALGYNMERGYGVKDDRGDHREILLPFRQTSASLAITGV
jgi:hypothetical protein